MMHSCSNNVPISLETLSVPRMYPMEGLRPLTTRLLVVEDEPQSARIVSRVLEISGYRCVVAANAHEARDLVRDEEFSLVVCDVGLPGESGLDLARFIIQQTPEAAVIMMSGMEDPKLINLALEIGAYGYVLKPLRPQQLLINIAGALRRRTLDIEIRFRQKYLEQVIVNRSTRLEEALDELQHGRQILQEALAERDELLAVIPSILIAVDDDGRITQWNRAAAQIFGVENSSIIGKPLTESGLPWDSGKLLSDSSSALKNGVNTRVNVPIRRTNGKEDVLCLNVVPRKGRGFFLLGSEVR